METRITGREDAWLGRPSARRAADTRDACGGYLKSIASHNPAKPEEVAILDPTALELDVSAMDRGYVRPAGPAYPLGVRIVASAG